MFGGLAFMVNGKMCVTAGSSEMMCRIDPALHRDLLKRTGARTVVMKNREYIGWMRVRPEAMRMKKDFDFWIEQALVFNQRARPGRKKA